MKRILLFILPLLAMMSSCIKDEMADSPLRKDKVRFTLQVQEEGVQYVTRATDEQTVRDVNLFLYDPRGVLPTRHFYVESGAVECSVLPGQYEAYAVANVHKDMGDMTREQLFAVQLPSVTRYTMLPMSGHTTLSVEERMPAPVITVRRTVAKIICNVSIDPSVAKTMQLQSVRIVNAAATTKLFEEEQTADRFIDIATTEIGASESRSATRTFYLLENCQGDVPSITAQQQKCAENAPQGATYVQVEAQQEGLHLTYDIYLGENNTSNFDVRRNTVQTLDIRIKGRNEVDTRVHSFGVEITDDMPDPDFNTASNEYCWYKSSLNKLTIEVDKPNVTGNLTGTILFMQGQQYAFHVNERTLDPGLSLSLTKPEGIYTSNVCYDPRVFTAANSRLIYDVSLSNGNGYSYTKRFTHDFYNHLTVYTYWNGREQKGGHLEDISAVRTISHSNMGVSYVRMLALDDGPQMRAVPDDGFAFKGWYADKELTQKVSDANPYQHPMTFRVDTLYTKFQSERVYIYTRIKEVSFVCPSGYQIDESKQAFIVLPGSRCTISGKDGRFVSVWWDKPETSMIRRIVSTDNPYNFIATANMTLIPGYDAVSKEELTSDRTATSTDQTPRR
ncbi:DUF4906 domain-containing protein [uncultured Alistipes sp.]|uniref:DUF4906 domain-containing protein n=1 Tax=uncultured Alistipes sp. TaxID=538949 RepID=UPI00272CD376|nr:DUF4906 domain-containing protein [uncultured Alistipes sp.]